MEVIVNKADREVVMGMIAQKYQVRIKALDDGVHKVVDAVQKKVQGYNQQLKLDYERQLQEVQEEVANAAKAFQASLRKKFHGRKIKTPAGINAKVSINMNALSAGVSLLAGTSNLDTSGVDIELAGCIARSIANNVNQYGKSEFKEASDKPTWTKRSIHNCTNYDSPECLENAKLIAVISRILEVRWLKNLNIQNTTVKDLEMGFDAKPSVTLITNHGGFKADNLRIVEHPEAVLKVKFENVTKTNPLIKATQEAIDAAVKSIIKLVTERNKLVQEFNDVTVRITTIRTPEKILEIAMELGLISKTENYDVLKGYTEDKHVKLLGEISETMTGGGLKALPAPQNSGVIIDVDAEEIED